ncbi:MAG: hypothetical protein RL685_3704 [Pseudomonadota bacterium]|jgi:hypothetical protein
MILMSMIQTSVARQAGRSRLWLGGALFVFVLALVISWAAQRRLDALFRRLDARTLDESAKVLDSVVAHQRQQLASTVGVLSEDSRIRAMVLTPTFDRATALDLLADLRATSGASLVAMLDGTGVVRAVVGAPEMDQLDLGTSALVKEALEKPAARLWAFANEVGVLAAAPVRLDQRVQALFMLGFALDDAVLEDIQRALGATGAVFVGEGIVASATKDQGLERALRAAAELPPGAYQIVDEKFLASSSSWSGSAVAARVAWLLPLHRHAEDVSLMTGLAWLPVVLVGLVLGFMIGLVWSQARASE